MLGGTAQRGELSGLAATLTMELEREMRLLIGAICENVF